MKKALTIIIGLLLLLPVGVSEDAAGTTASRCSELTQTVKDGDTFKFCQLDIEIESLTSTSIKVNGETINKGETKQVDGIEITYKEYATGEATITLTKKFEKKLKGFDEDFFKLFYGEDATFLRTADASTEKIAEISYGTNKAYARIRSSTPKEAVIGIDFENEDRSVMEKLHLSWKIYRMEIQELDLEKSFYMSTGDEPILFSITIPDEGKITLLLGDAEYTIELLPLANNEETNAIVLHSEETFGAYAPEASQELGIMLIETEKLWITTKLAKATAAEKSCRHNIPGSSLDDFETKSSVQGMYPAAPSIFFDIFTDYCKDDTTLVNYGCAGLDDTWDDTSRVSFLEVTCPSCSNGACTSGPYCMESDKYAADPTKVKGKVKVFELNTGEETEETAITNYNSGMEKFTKALVLWDKCKDENTLIEYSCDPTKGYMEEETPCGTGFECDKGACTAIEPECTTDADCVDRGEGFFCSAGLCITTVTLGPCEGVTCAADEECIDGVCEKKAAVVYECTPETVADACGPNTECVNGECTGPFAMLGKKPLLGVDNYFGKTYYTDNPIGEGECYNFPNDYLSVCLDSLSLTDTADYEEYEIEMVSDADLSQAISTFTSEKALHVSTVATNGLEIRSFDMVNRPDCLITKENTPKKTQQLYLAIIPATALDGSEDCGDVLGVFYKEEGRIHTYGAIPLSNPLVEDFPLARVSYGMTKDDNMILRYVSSDATNAVKLKWDINADSWIDLNDGADDIHMTWGLKNGDFNQLGSVANSEEPGELLWGSSEQQIGTKDEDHRTAYGIIIKNPKSNGGAGNGRVLLDVPKNQVYANVVIKGMPPTVGQGGVIAIQGGTSEKVALGKGLSNTTFFDITLDDSDISSLSDSEAFVMADQNDPAIHTSLTASLMPGGAIQDDFGTDAYLTTSKQKLQYQYFVDEDFDPFSVSEDNPLEIEILGTSFKIVSFEHNTFETYVDGADTKLTYHNGDAYFGEDRNNPQWIWNIYVKREAVAYECTVDKDCSEWLICSEGECIAENIDSLKSELQNLEDLITTLEEPKERTVFIAVAETTKSFFSGIVKFFTG